MVSSGPGPSLTIWSAASAHQTLLVMTVVAAIFVPFVLAYQGWSYWVFRQRLIRPAGAPGPSSPSGVPRPRAFDSLAAGELTIDGTEARTLPPEQVRALLAWSPEQPALLPPPFAPTCASVRRTPRTGR
jgi:hypothetical protein